MRFLFFPLLLSACATVTADSDQKIALATEPDMKAECVATSTEGSWTLEETPGHITVKRAFKPLHITCTAKGYEGKATLEPRTRGRAYGNILLLGFPAYVDASTGAGYEYAEKVIVTMTKVPAKSK